MTECGKIRTGVENLDDQAEYSILGMKMEYEECR
jgi:hypothetical protein